MRASKQIPLLGLALLILTMVFARPVQLFAQTETAKPSPGSPGSNAAQYVVQVDKVDPGDVNLSSSFQVAIYENLLNELSKTKRFKQVLRDGDRGASDASALLILKTTVQKYAAGSETRRAVTTVSGATKLTVRSQLCTRDGKVILERTVNGNVRFFGSNLRATHNLARHVAKAIHQAQLPGSELPAPILSGQL